MSVHSAGILCYRFRNKQLEVFLVHPGGPFWVNRDEGAWSIPKGLFEENETPLDAAKREFNEETGFVAQGTFIELGQQKQPSKKNIHAFLGRGPDHVRKIRDHPDPSLNDRNGYMQISQIERFQ